jgi:hypothetical protein
MGGIIQMVKKKASKLCKSVGKFSGKPTSDENYWENAILDADKLLRESEQRARELRKAIVAFRELRDSGEPWPGTASKGSAEDSATGSAG